MMKKHNDGYTLILVLVVMVVLCLVAVSILSVAASNWKKQQDSVARMQAKYEAQGRIEQIFATLQSEFESRTTAESFGQADLDLLNQIKDDDETTHKIVECAKILPYEDNKNYIRIEVDAYSPMQDGQYVCVSCELMLQPETGNITVVPGDQNSDDLYWIEKPVLSYSAYEITVIEGGNGQ